MCLVVKKNRIICRENNTWHKFPRHQTIRSCGSFRAWRKSGVIASVHQITHWRFISTDSVTSILNTLVLFIGFLRQSLDLGDHSRSQQLYSTFEGKRRPQSIWMIWEGKAVSHTSQRKRNIEIVISRGFGLFRAQNHNWSPWGHYWSLRWCLYSSCHCSWMTGKKRSDYIQRGLSRSCEICSLDDVVLIGLFFVRVVGTTVSPRWKLSDQISALKLLLPVENNRLMFQWIWFDKRVSMPLKRLEKAIKV